MAKKRANHVEQLTKVRPLNKNILVVPKREDEKTDGGVFIPEASRKVENYGTVAAVSGKVSEVSVGDIVLYLPYAGLEVVIGTRTYVSLSEEDIIAVIDPGNPQNTEPR